MAFEWWLIAIPAFCVGTLMPLALVTGAIGCDRPGGVQKLHRVPTSRLGGLVVVVAYLALIGVAHKIGHVTLAAALPLALAAVPVALIGLVEDLTGSVRPRYRLGAAVTSAALASVYAGGVIPRLDLPLVDPLLAHVWIVLPLTWFMVAGACNAINLVDGANGLAAGTALIMFGGIAAAAGWSGDPTTTAEALAVMGSLIGFLMWNYPGGKIFLGDAGAYFIGFIYAELSIRLIARNDGISAWYVIVLAGYPIADTLFAMYRRGIVRAVPLMKPDALHLHSLVFRRIALPIERRMKAMSITRANARVAPRLWMHTARCFALAVVFHDNTPALWLSLAGYAMFYLHEYRKLVQFSRDRVQQRNAAEQGRHREEQSQSP
jgi:UDP-N-acetylmuramyl pentapeptide phosphotransferase/UDP-N-acetylglucosamine-1-phosphate transferase